MAGWFSRAIDKIGSHAPAPLRTERERLYAAAVHSSNLAFLTTDNNSIITAWNPGAERMFAYTADEAVGRGVEMLVPIGCRNELAEILAKCRNGVRTEKLVTVRQGKGGEQFGVILDVSPLRSATNEQVGASAIMRDVTEQRHAEALFQVAVEACSSGMLMIDRSGRIVMVNGKIEHLFGYGREELLGQPAEILVPRDLRFGHKNLRNEFSNRKSGEPIPKGREFSAMRKDGSEFFAEIEINSARVSGEILVLACIIDISERKRVEKIKEEFIATVSHELRTPLTSVTASLALLSAGRAGQLSEPASRLVSIAHTNGKRLVRLVNDILDIEKHDSGKMVFTFEEVSARGVVEQAIEMSRAYAGEFGVAMRLDANPETSSVRADADRLAQVITNLLSNAIKFSPRGEDVVVDIAGQTDSIRISVRDHGPGIPDDFRPHVFERFAQADASDARKKGGTGLGLSIVKQIIDRLGGKIGFDSALGQGTLFFVEIPRWKANVDGFTAGSVSNDPALPDSVKSNAREVA